VPRTAVLRFLIASVLVACASAAVADPPPMPRFKITNRTGRTVTGTFYVMYFRDDAKFVNGAMSASTFQMDNVSIAPNASVERSFPTKIKHDTGGDAQINGAGPLNCEFMLGNEGVKFTNVPTCHNINQGTYLADHKYVYFNLTKGTPSLTAQDFCDVSIEWK
jgi:hypothetical protein